MKNYELLGVNVTLGTWYEMFEKFYYSIIEDKKCVVGTHNMQSIYLYHHLPRVKAFYQISDIILINGKPIIWFAKMLGYPIKNEYRFTFLDSYLLFEMASKYKWKIFLLGAKPGVAQKAIQNLQKKISKFDYGRYTWIF